LDTTLKLSKSIKEKAIKLGFEECGITSALSLKNHEKYFKTWLNNKYYAQMEYMNTNIEKRLDPSKLVEGAKSVIVVLQNYYSKDEYSDSLKTSKYALGIDYHYIIKEKLNKLLEYIKEFIPEVSGRVFVDSAPVLERALAQKAGLGWFGKNSMLINKKHGSFFFIGEIILDTTLEYDEPYLKEYCGECSKCIDSCPTGAILSSRVIDSKKCISYLTIEKRGDFNSSENKLLNDWIFGCDICQNVCPWNSKLEESKEKRLFIYKDQLKLTKEEWLEMPSNQFKRKLKSSPLQRAGLKQIIRNINANS
jgi:epoxyqueuosine reductase